MTVLPIPPMPRAPTLDLSDVTAIVVSSASDATSIALSCCIAGVGRRLRESGGTSAGIGAIAVAAAVVPDTSEPSPVRRSVISFVRSWRRLSSSLRKADTTSDSSLDTRAAWEAARGFFAPLATAVVGTAAFT